MFRAGALLWLTVAFSGVFGGAGCSNPITDAVIDTTVDPGGSLSVQIGDGPPGALPALAKGDPLAITGQSTTLVIALSCATDASGVHAFTALGAAGGTITLLITPGSGNQIQVHTGGQSCVADSGTITLTANADNSISGSFDASGTVMGSGVPVTLKGTLSEIPQDR
jgi:hypothetical protein